MSKLKSIDVTIEAVVDLGDEVHIVVTTSHKTNFTITEDSSIGGVAVRPWISQPRALDSDGKPRYDIYNLILVSKDHKDSFQSGEVHPFLVELNPTNSFSASNQSNETK